MCMCVPPHLTRNVPREMGHWYFMNWCLPFDLVRLTSKSSRCDILKEQEEHLQALFYKSPSYVRTLTDGGPRGLQLSRYSPNVAAPPLLELLISHKSKKSTDPKDKVYALV
jgi:hypothetical protein